MGSLDLAKFVEDVQCKRQHDEQMHELRLQQALIREQELEEQQQHERDKQEEHEQRIRGEKRRETKEIALLAEEDLKAFQLRDSQRHHATRRSEAEPAVDPQEVRNEAPRQAKWKPKTKAIRKANESKQVAPKQDERARAGN